MPIEMALALAGALQKATAGAAPTTIKTKPEPSQKSHRQ
jgi:hypothetical protein